MNIQVFIKYMLFLLIYSYSVGLFSQNFEKDFNGFFEKFATTSSFECRMSSNVFKNQKDTEPLIHNEAIYYMRNDEFYYAIDHLITLCNKNVLLMVDKKMKKIIVTKSDLGYMSKLKKEMMKNYEGLKLEEKDSLVYEGILNGGKVYTLYKPQSLVHKSVYTFDVLTGYLKDIKYVYTDQVSMGAAYATTHLTKVIFNPVFPQNIFDESIYLTRTKNELKPAGIYKDYKLLVLESDYEQYFK